MGSRGKGVTTVFLYVFLILVSVVALFPPLWGVITSLKMNNQIFTSLPKFIPEPPVLDHYVSAVRNGILVGFKNSIIISTIPVILVLFLASLAGYSISRLKWRGKPLVLVAIIAPQMLPGLVNLVPLYVMMARTHLLDSYTALILVYTAENLAMCTWIIKAFFDTVPQELEDVATVDGCNRWQVLYRIMLPLARPGLAAAALFVFLNSWRNFLLPAVMINSRELFPTTSIIYSFIGAYMVDWGGLMAAASLSVVPILLAYLFLQEHFVSGLGAGVSKF